MLNMYESPSRYGQECVILCYGNQERARRRMVIVIPAVNLSFLR